MPKKITRTKLLNAIKEYRKHTPYKSSRNSISLSSLFKGDSYQRDNSGYLDLSGIDLSKIKDPLFKGVCFDLVNLTNAKMNGSNFSRCHFKGAILNEADCSNSNFDETKFDSEKTYKSIGCDRIHETQARCTNFRNSTFNKASFLLGFGVPIDFSGSNFENAKLTNINDWIVNFNNVNFVGSVFDKSLTNPNLLVMNKWSNKTKLPSKMSSKIKKAKAKLKKQNTSKFTKAELTLYKNLTKEESDFYEVFYVKKSAYVFCHHFNDDHCFTQIDMPRKISFPFSPSGWKFHISVHQDDLEKAWNIMKKDLLNEKNGVSSLKVMSWKEKEYSVEGKQITIYVYSNKTTGKLDKSVDSYRKLFSNIEKKLHKANIKPGKVPKIEPRLMSSKYTSMRNDRDNTGLYVDATQTNNFNTYNHPNPFNELIVPSNNQHNTSSFWSHNNSTRNSGVNNSQKKSKTSRQFLASYKVFF
ncbi:MAG: pentapeptide repeat-containing protein [Gammaproteobacteria bacterium]|jgi:uncharacterized protein YjbI with pentapeptide repeats